MSSVKAEIGELVLGALEHALQQEGECRLIPKGKGGQGLLPGGAQTTAKKQAKDQCLDPSLGLFTVREVEEGKGKSASTVQYVTITRKGIELLFERRLPSARTELLAKAATPHQEVAREAQLQVAQAELKQIAGERRHLEEKTNDLLRFINQLVEDRLAELSQSRDALDSQAASLRAMAEAATPIPQPKEPQPSRPPAGEGSRLRPVTDGDIDFQRETCRELVYAWKDSDDDETRAALERVMLNSGLEPVGDGGEVVTFDGRDHETESDLRPGQAAVVVEPGWQLVSPRGTMLIARARVAPTGQSSEVDHAPHAQH